MVCVRVTFHENDGNHKNDENDKDNSDNYKQGVERWIHGNHRNHGNDENHGNPGCIPQVPQTTGLEIPEKRVHSREFSRRISGPKNYFYVVSAPLNKFFPPYYRSKTIG